jgi:putative transposase
LTIHADRGSSITPKPVAFLLADLGIIQSHSRPHVSDDNPFSESPVQDAEVPAPLPRLLHPQSRPPDSTARSSSCATTSIGTAD